MAELPRLLERVARVIDDCHAGRVTCDYYLGHPHGFHNHIYVAEAHYARPLHDPDGALARLGERTRPYPAALRRAVVEKYLYDATFMLELARKTTFRGDVFHVSGCLFRSVAALVQVLFALNERYFLSETGAVAAIESFPLRPESFEARAGAILGASGAEPGSLGRSFGATKALLAETRALADARGLCR